MALRFFDGFDHYAASKILNKWTTISNTITFVGGRFGGSALSTNQRSLTKAFVDSQPEWIFGSAMQFSVSSDAEVFNWYNGATLQGTLAWRASTRTLAYYRGNSAGTLLGSGTKVLLGNVWYYLELRVVFNDTTGIVQLKIDNGLEIDLSGQDTNNAGGNAANTLLLAGPVGGFQYDDLYLCDGTGPAPYNTFLGDCRVETLLPNGNGNSSQLAGSDGNSVDNYLLVDEADPNDDTDYVESSTVGQKDTYAYSDLAVTSGTVYAVQIAPWAKKTNAGFRSIKTIGRLSGTEEDSAEILLPSSYSYPAFDIRTTKPGGGAWTIADVNNAEFGVKVAA